VNISSKQPNNEESVVIKGTNNTIQPVLRRCELMQCKFVFVVITVPSLICWKTVSTY